MELIKAYRDILEKKKQKRIDKLMKMIEDDIRESVIPFIGFTNSIATQQELKDLTTNSIYSIFGTTKKSL